jgi:integrin beta 3
MWQKVTHNDDLTFRFAGSKRKKTGFHVWNLGRYFNGWQIRYKYVYAYTAVDGYWTDTWAVHSAGPPTPKPTPVPTPPPGHKGLKSAMGWKIDSGKCTIEIWGGEPCAVSPNYPDHYSDDQKCVVGMAKTKAVKVVEMSTEKYFDVLKVAGKTMSGAPTGLTTMNLPKGSTKIEWSSDFYAGSVGWKVCKEKPSSVPTPPGPKCDEILRGHRDRDYRGCQTITKTGRKCQRWEDQKPHKHGHMSGWKVKYYGLHKDYCRNADNKLKTIWCYTTDPKMRLEECYAGDMGGF